MSDIEMTTDETLELDAIIREWDTQSNSVIGNIRYEGNDSNVHNSSGIQTNTFVFDPLEAGTYTIPVNGQKLTVKVTDASGIINASGGEVSDITINGEDYRIHAFESVGSHIFSVNQAPSDATVDVLVVAGGGAGGPKIGAGGGAGGLVYKSELSLNVGSFNINVGAGAPRLQPANNIDYSESSYGGNSSAFGLLAKRGGHGGSHRGINDDNDTDGTDGGSGGGAGDPYFNGTNPGNATQPGTNPTADIDAGNKGGFPISNTGDEGGFPRRSAGGGGASEAGQEETYGGTDATGGDGIDMSDKFGSLFGENGVFAGGGGGFYYEDSGISSSQYEGGIGGGGDASNNADVDVDFDGSNAMPNTGGGGGGGSWKKGQGGAGGSGIVLIRYKI